MVVGIDCECPMFHLKPQRLMEFPIGSARKTGGGSDSRMICPNAGDHLKGPTAKPNPNQNSGEPTVRTHQTCEG